jgi:hypothetical protein
VRHVRPLLDDREPEVRLKVGLALVEARDKEAIPVLIHLLKDVSAEQTDTVEELLYSLAGEKAPAFTAGNTDTATGVSVPALKPGAYKATWTVKDPDGDTRILVTRFIEEPGIQSGHTGGHPSGAAVKVSCEKTDHGKKIKCNVTFTKNKAATGKLQVRLARGGRVAALGTTRVNRGRSTITMREIRRLTRGAWTITLVLSQPHKPTSTTRLNVKLT